MRLTDPVRLLAHAFGQSYSLPVPLWLFMYGGAAVVLLSFALISFSIKQPGKQRPRRRLWRPSFTLRRILRWLSAGWFGLILVSGLVGNQSPLLNFAVTAFWITFLLGFTYLIAIFGNFWPYINPLRLIVDWVEANSTYTFKPRLQYPKWLGYWPALITYFGLVWLELLAGGFGLVPIHLSWILIAYLLSGLTGSAIYGRETWATYGDLFSVFFGLVGRAAPIAYRKGQVYLRPPLAGLLEPILAAPGLTLFVVFMLASTAYDGLHETTTYSRLIEHIMSSIPLTQHASYQALETVLLVVSLTVFWLVYRLFVWLMLLIVKSLLSNREIAARFSLSLIPIAVAYNAAHYWPLLAVQGQGIVSLLSDPLGRGWNLFRTAGFTPNLGVVNASRVWYSQVALIVLGHIAAVYVSHLLAIKMFGSSRRARHSQYPILVLMITYTMTSLWIIAQPLLVG